MINATAPANRTTAKLARLSVTSQPARPAMPPSMVKVRTPPNRARGPLACPDHSRSTPMAAPPRAATTMRRSVDASVNGGSLTEVQGSRVKVQGSRFRVQGSGFGHPNPEPDLLGLADLLDRRTARTRGPLGPLGP